MNVLQTWLLFGVPGLVLTAALYAGRHQIRAWVGYAVLAALVAVFLGVDGGAMSAAVVGVIAVGLVATGRGTAAVEDAPEEQAQRDVLTRV